MLGKRGKHSVLSVYPQVVSLIRDHRIKVHSSTQLS